MKINIFYNTPLPRYYRVNSKYKNVLLKALGSCARFKGEVSLIITGASEMRRVNKQFLGHDYVTDTIAFGYPANKKEGAPFGDIFICFAQAKKQAAQHGHSALFEMLVLAAHGALHLAGWNDKTTALRQKMNARAESIAREVL